MRYSQPSQDSAPAPEYTHPKQSSVGSDALDEASQVGVGPSAFAGTDRPFLSKVLGFTTTEMRELELLPRVQEVDNYIVGLAKERHWVDTEGVYNQLLDELRTNLGLHRNLEPLRYFELLHRGVRLLRLQTKWRRREGEIGQEIQRLNKLP